MVGRESKYGFVLSWADEVEREEEEEAAAEGGCQAQLQQRQKPNPFGSARPREVVLQEKGIDWRKLDFHLLQHSPLRHESEYEKLQKQSNSQYKATILNDKEPDAPPTFGRSPVSSRVILSPRIQSPILFVPQLKYPPKFVAGVLYEHWVSVRLNASNSGRQSFKNGKENRFHEESKAHNLMSESAMCGNRRRPATESVQAKEARRKGRNFEESLVHGNKPGALSATRNEKLYARNSLGLPVANERIGPCEVQDKRMAANANQHGDVQDELGMDVAAFQVAHNSKLIEDKWQKITRKVQDLSVKQVQNCERDTTLGKIKGDVGKRGNADRANAGSKDKKKFVKKHLKLKT